LPACSRKSSARCCTSCAGAATRWRSSWQINALGYGLTLGIQTRIDSRAPGAWRTPPAVGNVYINRNMIGAVVGVQPFGGEGLSGTGPRPAGRTT
jgi:delta 1-pyrroline-5-carboxylate dehydrogenase